MADPARTRAIAAAATAATPRPVAGLNLSIPLNVLVLAAHPLLCVRSCSLGAAVCVCVYAAAASAVVQEVGGPGVSCCVQQGMHCCWVSRMPFQAYASPVIAVPCMVTPISHMTCVQPNWFSKQHWPLAVHGNLRQVVSVPPEG